MQVRGIGAGGTDARPTLAGVRAAAWFHSYVPIWEASILQRLGNQPTNRHSCVCKGQVLRAILSV